MPNLNGFEALARLRQSHRDVKVVFLTMHQNAAYARRALDARRFGVRGQRFGRRGIGAGHSRSFEREDIHHPFINETGGGGGSESGARGDHEGAKLLTPRRARILQLLTKGRSAKELPADLAIPARTVEFHKYQMMEMNGLHSSADLIHFAIKHRNRSELTSSSSPPALDFSGICNLVIFQGVAS